MKQVSTGRESAATTSARPSYGEAGGPGKGDGAETAARARPDAGSGARDRPAPGSATPPPAARNAVAKPAAGSGPSTGQGDNPITAPAKANAIAKPAAAPAPSGDPSAAPVEGRQALSRAVSPRIDALTRRAEGEARAEGRPFDAQGFRQTVGRNAETYGAAIDRVNAPGVDTVDAVADAVGDVESVTGRAGLKDAGGRALDGASGAKGIVLDTGLDGEEKALKSTATEELGERFFQSTFGGPSTGDFGAEVAGRVEGGLSRADAAALRSEAGAGDATTVDGEAVEARTRKARDGGEGVAKPQGRGRVGQQLTVNNPLLSAQIRGARASIEGFETQRDAARNQIEDLKANPRADSDAVQKRIERQESLLRKADDGIATFRKRAGDLRTVATDNPARNFEGTPFDAPASGAEGPGKAAATVAPPGNDDPRIGQPFTVDNPVLQQQIDTGRFKVAGLEDRRDGQQARVDTLKARGAPDAAVERSQASLNDTKGQLGDARRTVGDLRTVATLDPPANRFGTPFTASAQAQPVPQETPEISALLVNGKKAPGGKIFITNPEIQRSIDLDKATLAKQQNAGPHAAASNADLRSRIADRPVPASDTLPINRFGQPLVAGLSDTDIFDGVTGSIRDAARGVASNLQAAEITIDEFLSSPLLLAGTGSGENAANTIAQLNCTFGKVSNSLVSIGDAAVQQGVLAERIEQEYGFLGDVSGLQKTVFPAVMRQALENTFAQFGLSDPSEGKTVKVLTDQFEEKLASGVERATTFYEDATNAFGNRIDAEEAAKLDAQLELIIAIGVGLAGVASVASAGSGIVTALGAGVRAGAKSGAKVAETSGALARNSASSAASAASATASAASAPPKVVTAADSLLSGLTRAGAAGSGASVVSRLGRAVIAQDEAFGGSGDLLSLERRQAVFDVFSDGYEGIEGTRLGQALVGLSDVKFDYDKRVLQSDTNKYGDALSTERGSLPGPDDKARARGEQLNAQFGEVGFYQIEFIEEPARRRGLRPGPNDGQNIFYRIDKVIPGTVPDGIYERREVEQDRPFT